MLQCIQIQRFKTCQSDYRPHQPIIIQTNIMSLTDTTGLKDTTVKMAWGSAANLATNKLRIKNFQLFYKNMHHAFEGIMYLCCYEGILETESYYYLQSLVITNLTNTQEWCIRTQSLFWHPAVTQEGWDIYIYQSQHT